ncbi:MAG TPA: DUF3078 domain-containing protein [Bacteroidales bacterium]
MLKQILITCLFIASVSTINAQKDTTRNLQKDTVKYWKKGGFSVLTFNQVRLTNWSAGGEDALSSTAILNLFANFKKKDVVWDNSLDLGYGLMKSNGYGVRKNEDKIEFNSKFGYKAFKSVYYSVLLNYRTQFAKGFNYPNDSVVVSRFNAPGYLTLGIGLDFKPTDYLSVSLSPATGRLTIVADKTLSDAGAYGVDKGKRVRPAFGANLNAKFQKDVVKNVNVVSKLTLFNDYTDKDKANRKNIDVNWEVMVNIKAGKYLTTTILTNLIYDQNVIAKTQFKEVLGVGLSYKF